MQTELTLALRPLVSRLQASEPNDVRGRVLHDPVTWAVVEGPPALALAPKNIPY